MEDVEITLTKEARELGGEAARNAASWVLDGNASVEHYRRLIGMLDEGDPAMYDYLPREPNLSGEFADDPTPASLAAALDVADASPEYIDAIADAWEEGASEVFTLECERLLREAIS